MGKWKVNKEKINNDMPDINGYIEGFGVSYSTKRLVFQNLVYDDTVKETIEKRMSSIERATEPLPQSELPDGTIVKEPIGDEETYDGEVETYIYPENWTSDVDGVDSKFKITVKQKDFKTYHTQKYQEYDYYQDVEVVSTNTYEVTCYGNDSSDKYKKMFTNQIIPSTTINTTKTVIDCGDEPTPPEPPTPPFEEYNLVIKWANTDGRVMYSMGNYVATKEMEDNIRVSKLNENDYPYRRESYIGIDVVDFWVMKPIWDKLKNGIITINDIGNDDKYGLEYNEISFWLSKNYENYTVTYYPIGYKEKSYEEVP